MLDLEVLVGELLTVDRLTTCAEQKLIWISLLRPFVNQLLTSTVASGEVTSLEHKVGDHLLTNTKISLNPQILF